MRMYEGLFLIDNAHANMEWDNVVKHIHGILQKNKAEILKTEKWGEKKLAYKIKGHKRGTYLLIHFNLENTAISSIRRDFQLSDYIIRFLILKDDKIDELVSAGPAEETTEKEVEEINEQKPMEEKKLEENNVPVEVADEA